MSAKLGVDFLKQVSNYMVKSKSFDSILKNLKIIDGGEGRCNAEMTIGKEHINLHGGLHGGVTATLIDNVTTYALMSKPCHPGVSVDIQVMYTKSPVEGDCLQIDANTVQTNENVAYIECELRRKSDGELIAKGGQMKVRQLPCEKLVKKIV